MDNELDLWGNVAQNSGSANSVLSLIQEQATLLETKTSGRVKAEFSRIHYQYKADQQAKQMIQNIAKTMSILSSLTSTQQELIEVDERKNLEDAGNFYEQGKYKFEIYSDKYKFRLFILEYKSVFPLKLEVEYGILGDDVITENITSIDTLKNLLRSIFMSNKVRFIIQKMMELEAK